MRCILPSWRAPAMPVTSTSASSSESSELLLVLCTIASTGPPSVCMRSVAPRCSPSPDPFGSALRTQPRTVTSTASWRPQSARQGGGMAAATAPCPRTLTAVSPHVGPKTAPPFLFHMHRSRSLPLSDQDLPRYAPAVLLHKQDRAALPRMGHHASTQKLLAGCCAPEKAGQWPAIRAQRATPGWE